MSKELSLDLWHRRYTQQAKWSQEIRQYLLGKITLGEGDKILEVGSGTGAVLSLLSKETHAQCYGIDIDFSSLSFSAKLDHPLDLTAGDAYALPFPDNNFNLTYCHYLLLWIKHPLSAIAEMVRVTRPGGLVIALAEPDYQARIDHPPNLAHLGKIQTQSLGEQGAETAMGRKLSGLFHDAGLQNITSGILGAQWDPTATGEIDETEWLMIRADTAEHLSPEALEAYRRAESKARREERRVLFIPTFYASGFVP
ncbi:MAG: methyltransferase domain-containing protein [Brevefilum sp.]|nr:methyltransferase domain-containing protein [Brevefilum sp.]